MLFPMPAYPGSNIASNLPKHWFEPELVDELCSEPGLFGIPDHEFDDRVRARMVATVPGYKAALREEIDAQVAYNRVKHCKKSEPEKFYPARDRLFLARFAVMNLESEHKMTCQLAMLKEIRKGLPPSQREIEARASEDAAQRSLHQETFGDWLTTELELYTHAVDHPERINTSWFRSVSLPVCEGRLRVLQHLQRLAEREGLEAAFTCFTTPDRSHDFMLEHAGERLAMYGDSLAEAFHAMQTDDWFSDFDSGGSKYSVSHKDGAWCVSETDKRPVLLDPVKDAVQIEKNIRWSKVYTQIQDLFEQVRLGMVPITISEQIRHDVESFGLKMPDELEEAAKPLTPTRSVGRPRGVKNKPKRYPQPVNPHVAQWQAEADEKYKYQP